MAYNTTMIKNIAMCNSLLLDEPSQLIWDALKTLRASIRYSLLSDCAEWSDFTWWLVQQKIDKAGFLDRHTLNPSNRLSPLNGSRFDIRKMGIFYCDMEVIAMIEFRPDASASHSALRVEGHAGRVYTQQTSY